MIKNIEEQEEGVLAALDLNEYVDMNEIQTNLVVPGDLITSQPGFMHGSGTFKKQTSENKIYSAIVGLTKKTNRLLTVEAIRQKYQANVGDIVVGRIIDIQNRRWYVDIGADNQTILNLNSIYLEEQRKKTEQDEFNMKQFFDCRDIICAEVHSVNNDKTVNLHTRSIKYGNMGKGLLIKVQSRLIKATKKHFINYKDINIILPHNGFIWLSYDQVDKKEALYNISMLHNIVRILNDQNLQISIENIDLIWNQVTLLDLKSRDLNIRSNQLEVIRPIRNKIQSTIQSTINGLIRQGEHMGLV